MKLLQDTLVKLVKISSDNVTIEESSLDNKFHAVLMACGEPQVLCTGVYYTDGEEDCYIEKVKSKGAMNCPECKRIIKEFKSYKL